MVKDKRILLHINPPQLTSFDTFESVGGRIWPVSDILVKYLSNKSNNIIEGKNVLELGSGCGYVGIACGLMKAKKVILTDMLVTQSRMEYDSEGILVEDFNFRPNNVIIENCRKNVEINNQETRSNCEFIVKELMWGESYNHHIEELKAHLPDLDLIIGSDVTYHSAITPKLFWTIKVLLNNVNKYSTNNVDSSSSSSSSSNTNSSNSSSKNDLNRMNSINNKECRVILIHANRLEISTTNALSAAKSFGLQHTVLASGKESDCDYQIWEFKVNDHIKPLT